FFGSQIADQSVINYSYTDSPWRLLAWDTYTFFYYIWALPHILLPIRPTDSGHLSELAPTPGNLFCILIHAILVVLQAAFILLLPPIAFFIPLWTTLLAVGAFMVLNKGLSALLNGNGVIFHSEPQYASAATHRTAHHEDINVYEHERWIFLNGVAVGSHWMQSNLNRLALTFGRPIVGIHNRTSGILFDVIECLVQRNFGYATEDIRVCYRIMKETLYKPKYTKVVFILHSQGGIEGGLVLDWLLQELPQNLLCKLEVYTFGNAANHFNNPYRTMGNEFKNQARPATAGMTSSMAINKNNTIDSMERNETNNSHASQSAAALPPPALSIAPNTTTSTYSCDSHHGQERAQRAIRHIEHYAYTTDFVALWGVLHFATIPPATHAIPRFIGRLFARSSPNGRGGHQLVQHYLDGMFPLQRDSVTGHFVGCADDNAFMESAVSIEAKKKATVDLKGGGKSQEQQQQDRLNSGAFEREGVVKELSRLWKYRNGRSP
ncbi:hypothetical protein BD289DRAFT_340638, partial [Coniella lustricola]